MSEVRRKAEDEALARAQAEATAQAEAWDAAKTALALDETTTIRLDREHFGKHVFCCLAAWSCLNPHLG